MFEDTASGSAGRTDGENFPQSVVVDFRDKAGVAEQGFWLGTEDQSVGKLRVKQGLGAGPVPVEKQFFLSLIPDGKGKDAVEPLNKILAVAHVGVEDNLGV